MNASTDKPSPAEAQDLAQEPPDHVAFWTALRPLTSARIGLRRTGASLATAPVLDIQLAHARARDAVHELLDAPALAAGMSGLGLQTLTVASYATDRRTYLMRPDLGRMLAPEDAIKMSACGSGHDVVFAIVDGLSARAVQMHAAPVLTRMLPLLRADEWRVGPVVIVRHGRVAVGDAIACAIRAESVVVLIGERPGLTAPYSMGIYVTWQPHPQSTDADRNCISNIRPEGTDYTTAALQGAHLLGAMRTRRLSGVMLKNVAKRLTLEPP